MDIEKALEIFNENPDLATFVLDQGGQRIELSRFSPNQSTASKSEAVCLNTEKSVDLAEESLTGHQVCSPMVGTLYLSPSPGEQTYVKPGDLVKEGDVLCLIEAMKMFTPMSLSSFSEGGTSIYGKSIRYKITRINMANGQQVNEGDLLFVIRKELDEVE